VRRAPRGLAACAAAAVLLASCGGGEDRRPAEPGDGSPARGASKPRAASAQAELQALLDRRAKALEARDATAYAATATGAQRAHDRRTARNARGLSLRDVRLAAAKVHVEGRRAVLRVSSSYGVAGIRGRFEGERRIEAARTADGWRVRAQTTRRQHHPWEDGPFTERRGRHFLVLAPPELQVDGLMDVLEAGYDRMREVLVKGRLRERYLVVVAGDARQARRLTEGIRGVADLAAISDSSVREAGPAERVVRVASQRLLVVWPAFSALGEEDRRRVVAHELTHAVLAGATSGRTPAWLVEGVALYVSGDRRVDGAARLLQIFDAGGPQARAASRVLSLRGLSRPEVIAGLSGDGQSAAYDYSSAAAFYVVERFGRDRLLELYDAFNDEDLEGDAGPRLADRAVRRTLGVRLGRLEGDLREWIATGGGA
jgi:hypothetical protein